MTQKEMILGYMRKHGSITSMQAFQMGITRLSARIWDLRNDGVQIESHKVKYRALDGKNKCYDEYKLVKA
jgi:biotin operon repressor